MAVEARHLNLFPSHLLCTREMLNPSMENATNLHISQAGMAVVAPATESVLPFYNSHQLTKMNNQMANPPLKDDSGLTFNNSVVLPFSRKRPREATAIGANNRNDFNRALISVPNGTAGKVTGRCGSLAGGAGSFSFLGEDLSLQMMQQQLEVDRLVSLHMENVRLEMEERRRKQSRRIIGAIDEAISKKLREKDVQMERIGKLNCALEERVKSLNVENQILRDIARANEAAAISLQSNLDQVLAQVNNNNNNARIRSGEASGDIDYATGAADDTESCCGSSGDTPGDYCEEAEGDRVHRWRKVERKAVEEEEERKKRMCRRCGGMESCVLVLPCRHLCLCTVCGPTVDTCPICNSTKSASVHVNFS